jgi:SRSO17 transposase
LIAVETGEEKSSKDAVGAGYQHSGSVGGIGLCQLAVHLAYATTRGHTILDRPCTCPGTGPPTTDVVNSPMFQRR